MAGNSAWHVNRAGTARAAHAPSNFFPAFSSIPGAATMQFRWNFYEYSRGKLRPLLPGAKSEREQTLVSSGQTLYRAAPLENSPSCCSSLLQNLVKNSEETQCLQEISRGKCRCSLSSSSSCNSIPVVSFLSISLLPFSILSLLPLHHPFFPPKIKTSFCLFAFCFTPCHLIMHSISLKKTTNFDA